MDFKQNDWAAVLLNAESNENINLGKDPLKTFYVNGITPENTGLQDSDYYKSIPQVIDRFTKDGEFDEKSYQTFYDSALRLYNEFTETPFIENILDDIGVTSYDSSRLLNPEAKVKNLNAKLLPIHDRNRSTHGTSNIWENGSKTFSDREVAQANFVRDENGNVLDWKPNDRTLFRGIFDPALVYASYTEDVYDNEGRLIHQKGELKLDENGDPYTELLGDRPAYGQDIVNWTDNLTVDGSMWNKLDFFDSDGLEKDMWKTVAKTAVMMAPFFTPVGQAFGWVHAALGLTTALPSLVKSLNGLVLGDSDSEFMKSMTRLENIMGRFKPTTSDESRGRFFSWENIGDLLVSSSAQLFSQRNIANSLYKAKPFVSDKANKKFAEIMSTGYMALTSTSDVYGEMKQAGANDFVAGAGSILSLAGFYTLLSHGYFKDRLFQGSLLDEDQKTLYTLKELVKDITKRKFTNTATQDAAKKGFAQSWSELKPKLMDVIKGSSYKYGLSAYTSRSINEGLEETSEEIMMDTVKWMAKGLEIIGLPVSEENKELNFGRTFENTLERWGTSFVGGFLGGAVFELHNQVEMAKNQAYLKWRSSTPIKQIYQYVAQGEADHLRDIIKKRGSSGKNGNKNLTASYKEITGTDGKIQRVYNVGTDTDNQNLAITNALLAIVDNAESIYQRHNMIFKNEDLLKMVLGTKSLSDFMSKNEWNKDDLQVKSFLGDRTAAEAIVEAILDLKDEDGNAIGEAIATNVLQDIDGIRQEIIDVENKIAIEEAKKGNNDKQHRPEYLKKRKEERDSLVEKFQSLINGDSADNLLTQILLFFDGNPLKNYIGLGSVNVDHDTAIKNIERYANLVLEIDYNENTNDEIKAFVEDSYSEFKNQEQNKLRRVADLHIKLSDQMRSELAKANDQLSDVIVNDKYIRNYHRHTIAHSLEELKDEIIRLETAIKQYNAMGADPASESKYYDLVELLKKRKQQLAYFDKLVMEKENMTMEQWFDYDLDLTEDDSDASLIEKQNQIVQFYEDAVKNKAVFVDDQIFMSYLNQLNVDGIRSKLRNLRKLHGELDDPRNYYYDLRGISDDGTGLLYSDVNNESLFTRMLSDYSEDQSDTNTFIAEAIASGYMETFDNANVFAGKLQSEVENFLMSFKGDAASVFKAYDDLINWINHNVNLSETSRLKLGSTAEELVRNILNGVSNGNDLLKFILNVRSKLEGIKTNPIYDWTQLLHQSLFGAPSRILDFIKKQRSNLSDVGLHAYILGESAKIDIENSTAIINILMGLIEASSPNNLNEILNSKRSGYKNPDGSNKEDFTILNENAKEVLVYELEFIRSQLATLAGISERNEKNKIDEDKNIAKVDSVSRFSSLVMPKEGTFEFVLHEILKASGFDFEEFYSENYNPETAKNWTDAAYENFAKIEFKFKQKLYNFFSSKNDDEKTQLMVDIATACKDFPALLNMKIDSFTNDHSKIGSWGTIRYLLSNLTTDISEFNNLFAQVSEDSEYKYLPFYGQEFVMRDAYSSFLAKDLYNIFLSNLNLKFKAADKSSGWKKDYIDNMNVIKNFLFIDGVPGSGKTSAVAATLAKILKKKLGNDLVIITLTHTDDSERIKSFGDALGSDESHRFTFSDFINTYINSGVLSADKSKENGHSTSFSDKNKVPHETLNAIVGDAKQILIFSDEQTFANEAQLIAFSNYSDESNDRSIYMVGLGDLFQSGVDSKVPDITDLYYQSSVRLTTTFRSENNGKAYNERIVRDALSTRIEEWSKDRTNVDTKSLGNAILNDIKATMVKKPLIGWQDSDGRIYGDVSSDFNNIASTIEQLKNLKIGENEASVAIISDNPEKYASYQSKNVSVKSPMDAQGGEWDFVIIDATIDLIQDNVHTFNNFKKFYTLMTRARHGSIWNGDKVSALRFEKDISAKTSIGADMKLNSIGRDKYISWRKKLFSLLGATNPNTSAEGNPGSPSTPTQPISKPLTPAKPVQVQTGGELDKLKKDLAKDLYSELTDDDPKYFREKYYESDDDEQFNKSHEWDKRNYKERKQSIQEGKSFDDDSYFDFIENADNLINDCYDFDISKRESYVAFLYQFNAKLMNFLSSEVDKRNWNVFIAEIENMRDNVKYRSLLKVIDAIKSGCKDAQLTIKKKANQLIVYYEFGENAIPVSALSNHEVNYKLINTSYKLNSVKTSAKYPIIPISSNGERFIKPEHVKRKNITFSDKILIFKGYTDEELKSVTFSDPKTEHWHETNRGKAFVVIGNVNNDSIQLDVDNWPKLLDVRVGTNGGIDYFIDPKGNIYVKLAGVQRVCTTDTFNALLSYARNAKFATTDKEYKNCCEQVRDILGLESEVKLPNNLYKDSNDKTKISFRGLVSPTAWRYLQSMAVGLGTDPKDSSFIHLSTWLNPKTNKDYNNAITFKIHGNSDYIITVYRDKDVIKVSTKNAKTGDDVVISNVNEFMGDANKSLLEYITNIIVKSINELKLTNDFQKSLKAALINIAENEADKAKYNALTSLSDLVECAFVSSPRFGIDIDFKYHKNNESKFWPSDPFNLFLPLGNEDSRESSLWTKMIANADLFAKHGINLTIRATSHGTGNNKVYGTVNWLNGTGFDIVEVIPTNYSVIWNDPCESRVIYNGDSTHDGVEHQTKIYTEVDGEWIFENGPIVSTQWLNTYGIGGNWPNGAKIVKTFKSTENGEVVTKVVIADINDSNKSTTINIRNANTLFHGYTAKYKQIGNFTKKGKDITYNDKPFIFIGFGLNNTCIIYQDGEFIIADFINETNRHLINASVNNVIYSTNEYVVTKDDSNNITIHQKLSNKVAHEKLILNVVDGKILVNNKYEYTSELKNILAQEGSNENLVQEKNKIKKCIKKIADQSDLKDIFDEINTMIDSASGFEIPGLYVIINEILKDNAYKLGALYKIKSDGSYSIDPDNYSIAPKINVPPGYEIVEIIPDNNIYFVSLSNGKDSYVEKYQYIHEKLQKVVDINWSEKLSKLIALGVPDNYANTLITSMQAGEVLQKNAIYEELSNRIGEDDDSVLDKIDEVMNILNCSI